MDIPAPVEVTPAQQRWPIGTVLGVSSLIISGMSFLFALLPCFWFLALPLSGLGLMIGFAGSITALVRKEWMGLVFSLVATVLGFFLTVGVAICVFYFQYQMDKSLKEIDKQQRQLQGGF